MQNETVTFFPHYDFGNVFVNLGHPQILNRRSLKKLVIYLVILASLTSCSAIKKSSAPSSSVSEKPSDNNPRFIENITIAPREQSNRGSDSKEIFHAVYTKADESGSTVSIESLDALRIKYAILLDLPVETTFNSKMLEFIEEWYGTPYRFGGTTKKGIDCSAFVNFFMSAVYGLSVPRNSREQYSASKRIKKKQLDEGDLVFFSTRGGISHVGVYIGHNKFAHASTSNGVMISDLDEEYFARHYAGSGRIR